MGLTRNRRALLFSGAIGSWMSGRGSGRRGRVSWMFVPLARVLGTVLLVKTDAPEGRYEHFTGPWYIWSDGP
ncbi:hypothetical protein ACFPOI_40060 [Nonomuraea angiospora]|uniref:Uncharacterized protein n=1 Tax=Nonomuraea angiospora TaxID=46172 RepID=A0ABR9M5L2_9ACTN|nr:hypothetical protein [Nonomuraea angiospora]MBE1587817.1 hypothetical protein [Nonomuraea angiospora]